MINVNVVGRLGADAEVVEAKNGTKFVTFRMATDDFVESKKATTWMRVRSFDEKFLKQKEYLTKGKLISIIGTLSVSLYQSTKDGSTQASIEVNAHDFQFISAGNGNSEKSGSEDTGVASTSNITTGTFQKTPETAKVKTAAPVTSVPDDDLPF